MSSRLLVCASCLIAVLTANAAGAEPPKPKDGAQGTKFVPLPKGTFYMGWNGEKGSAKKTEIKEDFEIAIHTVTQSQWQEVMGKNPSEFSRDGKWKDDVKDIKNEELKLFPVENVSWDDCQEFIKKLNEQEKGKGWLYRLPSDAEWEYACRGGPQRRKSVRITFTLRSRRTTCPRRKRTSTATFRSGRAMMVRSWSARRRWVRMRRTSWVCTICTATCGSGAPTCSIRRPRSV